MELGCAVGVPQDATTPMPGDQPLRSRLQSIPTAQCRGGIRRDPVAYSPSVDGGYGAGGGYQLSSEYSS